MNLVRMDARAALDRDGLVVLRRLLSGDEHRALTATAARAFAAVDRGLADPAVVEQVAAWGGLSVPDLAGCGMPAEHRAAFVAPIAATVPAHLGPVAVVEPVCVIRRHTDLRRTRTYWHIDADGAGTAPWDPVFNVWVPFGAVGVEQPSLELLPGSHAVMRTLPLRPAETAARPDDWVAERFPGWPCLVPVLEPGDAVVFSHWTLHRTQRLDRPTVNRMSAEFRVTQHPGYL